MMKKKQKKDKMTKIQKKRKNKETMKKQKDAQKRKEKKQKNIKVVEDEEEEEEKEEEKDDEEEILNRTQWDPGKDATTTELTDFKERHPSYRLIVLVNIRGRISVHQVSSTSCSYLCVQYCTGVIYERKERRRTERRGR